MSTQSGEETERSPESAASLPEAPPRSSLPLLLSVLCLVLLLFVWTHHRPSFKFPPDHGFLIRGTVCVSLGYYALAATLMLRLRLADWAATTSSGRLARTCWTLACLAYLIHVAFAFHYIHHWSHAEAFEHVRQAGGVGEGIFVSYLFTLLWTGDVMWWWIAPLSYAGRSVWIDRALHGFMAFVIFNGTVVFASGFIRWAGVAMFIWLVWLWASRGRASRGREPPEGGEVATSS